MADGQACLDSLKACYAEWDRSKGGSVDTWLRIFADEVDFRSLADGHAGIPWTASRRTKEAVRRYLEELNAMFRMDHYTVDRFICQDDTIVMIGSTAWTHRTTGKQASSPKVDVWRFDSNGKAIGFFELYDTANVIAAATPDAR